MNLIDRYINAVALELPEVRKDEITRELKANILDSVENLAEQQGRAATADDVSTVLRLLGHPQKVAASFLPPQSLVSSEWFPFFKQCLGYGLMVVFVLQLISFGAELASLGRSSIVDFLGGLLHASLLMFASVTAGFYLLSNFPSLTKITPYGGWKPEQLPPVEQPWQRIKVGNSASDLITHTFTLLVLQCGLWLPNETLAQLPLRFAPVMHVWIMPLTLWVSIFIGFNLWNLRFGFWTKAKLIFNVIMNLLGGAAAFILINLPNKLLLIEQAQNPLNSSALEHLEFWVVFGAGCLCLFEAAQSGYRLYLIKK